MIENRALLEKIRLIKGERTVREFAKDAGVSTATISKYLTGNGKGTTSLATLEKMADPKAFPRNGITLQDLLFASGTLQCPMSEVPTEVFESFKLHLVDAEIGAEEKLRSLKAIDECIACRAKIGTGK